MKLLFFLAALIFNVGLQQAVAAESVAQSLSNSCQVVSESSEGGVSVLNCADGKAFEIRQVLLRGQKCSSSIWCSSFEHCVGGVCKPKDIFNRCDAFSKKCSFPEKCIDGVCKR